MAKVRKPKGRLPRLKRKLSGNKAERQQDKELQRVWKAENQYITFRRKQGISPKKASNEALADFVRDVGKSKGQRLANVYNRYRKRAFRKDLPTVRQLRTYYKRLDEAGRIYGRSIDNDPNYNPFRHWKD